MRPSHGCLLKSIFQNPFRQEWPALDKMKGTNQNPYLAFCGATGVWLSSDAGKAWSAQNDGLGMLRGYAFNPTIPSNSSSARRAAVSSWLAGPARSPPPARALTRAPPKMSALPRPSRRIETSPPLESKTLHHSHVISHTQFRHFFRARFRGVRSHPCARCRSLRKVCAHVRGFPVRKAGQGLGLPGVPELDLHAMDGELGHRLHG